jgi:nicotinamidase-related amidase
MAVNFPSFTIVAVSAPVTPNISSKQAPAARPLAADNCALLVIDIQQKLLPPIHEKVRLVKNSQLLIRLANILKLPVLVTTQYEKGLGKTVPEIAALLPEQAAHDKQEFSCFANKGFCSALQGLPQHRKTLLLCGMETHICVLQTALGALAQDYVVHIAADAVGSRSELNWNIGLDRMRAAGAVISSTETILYELLRGSGGAAFKELLPHLKS